MSNETAITAFLKGGIIAYPTEAVFGLGCDPDNEVALQRLLTIKKRSPNKGLILLASDFEQLLPYVDMSEISSEQQDKILSRWPNGITQVLRKKCGISRLLSGTFDSIAVRITTQPDVVALCRAVNRPIVSTSANLSGLPAASDWRSLDPQLLPQLDHVIRGFTLGFEKPSTIIDAISGEQFRS